MFPIFQRKKSWPKAHQILSLGSPNGTMWHLEVVLVDCTWNAMVFLGKPRGNHGFCWENLHRKLRKPWFLPSNLRDQQETTGFFFAWNYRAYQNLPIIQSCEKCDDSIKGTVLINIQSSKKYCTNDGLMGISWRDCLTSGTHMNLPGWYDAILEPLSGTPSMADRQ